MYLIDIHFSEKCDPPRVLIVRLLLAISSPAQSIFMMGRCSVGLFLLAILPFCIHGYNLNENNLGNLVGDRNNNSLFGWSLQHFNDELYIGAPGENGTGAVYRCANIDTFPNCKKMSSPRLTQNSWYGGSLAASSSNLYTCSFRYGYNK